MATPLFDLAPAHDGPGLEPADHQRLGQQQAKVLALMSDGRWRTLDEITRSIGAISEAGVSARLRDLRKCKFGSHTVERRRLCGGVFEYRVKE